MRHAIIYDRASDEGQKENWSRQDAIIMGEKLASDNKFDTWEIRQEVKSGEELSNRPIMKGILDDIESGKVQALICQNLSRLSRDEDGIDGRFIRQLCRENNVLIITPDMVYDFSHETHDDMADFQFMAAKWYKRNMVKQVIQGLTAKARTGGFMGGVLPLGYEFVHLPSENDSAKPIKDYAINPNEAELAALIFKTHNELNGNAHGTVNALNAAGFRKPRRHKRSIERTGEVDRPFFQSDVVKIIENLYMLDLCSGERTRPAVI